MRRTVVGLIVGLVFPVLAVGSPGVLENPQGGSTQGGIGTLSGWVCTATRVDLVFDDTITVRRSICGMHGA